MVVDKLGCTKSFGGILEGISSLTRGVTQVITTPLTWFLKMPTRVVMSVFRGMPTFNEQVKTDIEVWKRILIPFKIRQ